MEVIIYLKVKWGKLHERALHGFARVYMGFHESALQTIHCFTVYDFVEKS